LAPDGAGNAPPGLRGAQTCCDTSVVTVLEHDVDAQWSNFVATAPTRKTQRRWVIFLAGLLVGALVTLGVHQLSGSSTPPRAKLESGGGGVIGFSPSGGGVAEQSRQSPFGSWVEFQGRVEPDTLWWMIPIFNQGSLPVTILHIGPPPGSYPSVSRALLAYAPDTSWSDVRPFRATTIQPRSSSTFELRITLHCDGLPVGAALQFGSVPITYSFDGATHASVVPVTMAQVDGPTVCPRGQ
jgi:hypothetical protein